VAVQTVLNTTSANAALKELYSDQVVQNMVYSDNPFLAMVPKKTDFGGKYKPIPIIIGTSQGASALFANAQANQTSAVLNSFLLTRVSDYSIAQIQNELLLASKTDKMAFIEGAKVLVDAAIRAITNSVASGIFRSGTGSIGAITTITSGVIALTNAADVVQFELNQTLQAAATDGASPRAAKGYVIAVNRSAGTVTMSTTLGGTAATPTSWTNADFVLRDGDSNAKCSGLAAWLPPTAPTSTTFFGVDRSVDTVRLGGVRYDGSAQTIEEAIIDAASLVAREGGRPTKFITNFASFAALEKSLGSKVQYVDLKGPAEIAFRGIKVFGANTTIDVFPDRNCPALVGYLLQMDTWALEGLGDVPQILRYGDGMEMLRVYNADAAELRCGAYFNLRTNAPGWNAYVALSA
jgi:hypothetical protein